MKIKLLIVMVLIVGVILFSIVARSWNNKPKKIVDKQQGLVISQSVCDEVLKQADLAPVKIYEGKPAKVDFSTIPDAKSFYTAITTQASEGSNFAGHYTYVGWGCGTDCAGYAIVDSITGKVVEYMPANEDGNSYSYNDSSRIFVLNPKEDFDQYKGKTIDEIIKDDTWYAHLVRTYYALIEEEDGEVWISKVCSENALDGVYAIGSKEISHGITPEAGSAVTYFAKIKRWSTSGDIRFYWYDTELKQIKDIDNQYAWFFGSPTYVFDSPGNWVSFFENNKNSVFKITGTKGKDDCDYYGLDHCIENINIDSIEIVREKLPNTETAGWKGKTTDWLGRTYDVNNPGKEYEDDNSRVASYTGWTISGDPYTINKGDLQKVEEIEINWDDYTNKKIVSEAELAVVEAKTAAVEAKLTSVQKQYFYDNNYVPRSVERFDVTGDGIAETIVTSLTLGCGRCVDFFMTIFTKNGKYNARTNQGTIIKTENGNGFYLTNDDWNNNRSTIDIRKYKWGNSLFTEVARKEVILETK